MGIFGRREGSKRFRIAMAEKYDNSVLKYVTEQQDGIERVIAKRGYITVRDGILTVSGEERFLFQSASGNVTVNPLMSGDGIIVSGTDMLSGEDRSLVCYFLYYRKVDD